MQNVFSKFTNLYELQKTLRFELKPVGNTEEMLKGNHVFQKDKIIDDNYQKIKPFFDQLHRKFIDESLANVTVDYGEFWRAYLNLKKNQKDSKLKKLREHLRKVEAILRKEIVKQFIEEGNEWKKKYEQKVDPKGKKLKFKKKGFEILFDKNVLEILRQEFPSEKELFESFRRFTTYFTNFHESRKNFYSDGDEGTAVANRIVNENLHKFCENKRKFEEKYKGKKIKNLESKMFDLAYYNNCLLQSGIDAYDDKVGKINSEINKLRQTAPNKNDYPLFTILFKQILGEESKEESDEDAFIEINNNDEVFSLMKDFVRASELSVKNGSRIIKDLLNKFEDFDLSKVYISAQSINTISNKWFINWSLLRELLPKKEKGKSPDFVAIEDIKMVLEENEIETKDLFKEEYKKLTKNSNNFLNFLSIWKDEFNSTLLEYQQSYHDLKKLLKKDKEYTGNKKQKEVIKNFADSVLGIYQMIKYFVLRKEKILITNIESDPEFYNEYNEWFEETKIIPYYTVLRNYLTKKPYDEDKIKLNFDNGTLLDGWDKNKESDNFGVILRKDRKYYLGIMLKESNKVFDERYDREKQEGTSRGYYEKMVYKLLPDPKRMLPKVCFSKKNKDLFTPSEEIMKIYKEGRFKVNTENFSLSSMQKLIDFYKESLKKYENWRIFDFQHIRPTREYQTNIGEFYRDIEKNSWKVWFEKVSDYYVKTNVDNGELYLFEIYNKDFSESRTGNKNVHTLYWEALFSEDNIQYPVIKLNGKAEIFFRKASMRKDTEKRTTKPTAHSIVPYRRYTEDKFLFHCPISLNFTSSQQRINDTINRVLTEKDVNIIGIDRGEKHLAYYTIMDQKGKILEADTLNVVNNIDYHKKLDELEIERADARKNWQSIAKIKDLKKGYISHVVRKLCDLILKNAIIVFEDLNIGFKRGRFKIEKQTYQKLELALAQKLNYLVNKSAHSGEPGHFLKAYQLTPPVNNFRDIGKQCGIIFYTTAGYTSTTCPKCGFRKSIYLNFQNIKKAKSDLQNIEISYDGKHFKFEYNPKDFHNRFQSKTINKEFILSSDVTRLRYKRSKDNRSGTTEEYDVTEGLKELFKKFNIDREKDISEQIESMSLSSDFYRSFIFYINLLLQLRNSDSKSDQDYISCPVCGFHSDHPDPSLAKLKNGDAVGAYNIARKGKMILDKIHQFGKTKDLSKLSYKDFQVNIEEWDAFVTKK